MHRHTHITFSCECEHECLHYCEGCGKVYCCECGREWGDSWNYYYNPPTWGTTTTTCDANDEFKANCAHAH